MLLPHQEFIDAIKQARTIEEAHTTCAAFCEWFGFDYFLYAARIPTSLVKPSIFVISGYPDAWRNHYNENNYMLTDPTVAYCAEHLTPASWETIRKQLDHKVTSANIMSEAHDFGLSGGISIPVHTINGESAMFSMVCRDDDHKASERIQRATPFAHLFTAHLHEAMQKFFQHEMFPVSQAKLTDREKECLLWTAEGKTSWEISQILDISERTVTFHVQNAAEKLRVVNRSHAVARAIATGQIRPYI